MRAIRSVRGGASAIAVSLLIAASQVPSDGQVWLVWVLLAFALLALITLLGTMPALTTRVLPPSPLIADLFSERRAAVREGKEVPSTQQEFSDAWQYWCDELTAQLRLQGYANPNDPPERADYIGKTLGRHPASLLQFYLTHLRSRALVLYDEMSAREPPDLRQQPRTLRREAFHHASTPEELWQLNDNVYKFFIEPFKGYVPFPHRRPMDEDF
jgi:hypothetical protein